MTLRVYFAFLNNVRYNIDNVSPLCIGDFFTPLTPLPGQSEGQRALTPSFRGAVAMCTPSGLTTDPWEHSTCDNVQGTADSLWHFQPLSHNRLTMTRYRAEGVKKT